MHNVAITCLVMFHLQNYRTETFISMHADGWRHDTQMSMMQQDKQGRRILTCIFKTYDTN